MPEIIQVTAQTRIDWHGKDIEDARDPNMKVWYATFGNGSALRQHVIKLHATDDYHAHQAMHLLFGNKFCAIYPASDEFLKTWGYTVIEVPRDLYLYNVSYEESMAETIS